MCGAASSLVQTRRFSRGARSANEYVHVGREGGARYAGPALARRNGYYPYRPLLMAGAAGEAGDEVDAAGDVDGDVAAAGGEGDGRFGRRWER